MRKGAPLELGEDLFEIAPLSNMVAEIAIPESEISYVEVGMQTRIVLEAFAGQSQTATIQRIHPRNEMLDGESVFIAEADLENVGEQSEPWNDGSARVSRV